MRKRSAVSRRKSKKLFRKTAKPVILNKPRKGLKRGGHRL